MDIIDGLCEIPGFNVSGNKTLLSHGFQRVRYASATDDTDLPAWAAAACSKLLCKHGISIQEVGTIVSISVSAATDGSSTAAPGICHSIQKKLGATNAFVFDAFYNDWGTALDIANALLLKQEHHYGLIVKAEMFTNFEIDEANGFVLPDGVSVILFKAAAQQESVRYFYTECNNIQEASVSYVPNKDLENCHMKFQLKWKQNNDTVKSVQKEQHQMLQDDCNHADLFIKENWFPYYNDDSSQPVVQGKEMDFLGMHYLPWRIQHEKADGQKKDKTAMALLFNPFALKHISFTFKI